MRSPNLTNEHEHECPVLRSNEGASGQEAALSEKDFLLICYLRWLHSLTNNLQRVSRSWPVDEKFKELCLDREQLRFLNHSSEFDKRACKGHPSMGNFVAPQLREVKKLKVLHFHCPKKEQTLGCNISFATIKSVLRSEIPFLLALVPQGTKLPKLFPFSSCAFYAFRYCVVSEAVIGGPGACI